MPHPDAYLLSPYRPPTSYPVSLDPDEAAAWLAGYFALWHPAVLARIGRVPQIASAYDHDQPHPDAVYCIPVGPAIYQPDDWAHRAHEAGAVAFEATTGQTATLAQLHEALGDTPYQELPADVRTAFAAVGYGHLLVDGLFEAADHDRLLDAAGFWADLKRAVETCATDPRAAFAPLRDAADKLRAAREGLTPSQIHLMDWAVLSPDALGTPWPGTLAAGLPLTVAASAELLERQARDHPERSAELRAAFRPDLPAAVDIACGGYAERDDVLLPPESQWWNLVRGRAAVKQLLGVEPAVYARRRTAAHPQTPAYLQHCGYKYAVLAATDGAMLPGKNAAVLNWPSPDGKSVDAIGREPRPAGDPLTFFNLVHTLHAAIASDSAPLVVLSHTGRPPAIGYAELLALADLSSVVGEFTTVPGYLGTHQYGEYLGTATADDFAVDTLDDRVTARHQPDPVSAFARQQRDRRRLDGVFALAGMLRSLQPPSAADCELQKRVETWENDAEAAGPDAPPDPAPLAALEVETARTLADRLQARASARTPGLLVFNPTAATRRIALEVEDFGGPVPVADPVKAAQFDGRSAKLVVEVPGLGFAYVAKPAGPVAPPKMRLKTADGTTVRNEFFEAELDPATGGLKAFRDARTRLNRLGMQLVWNPGSTARARTVAVTSVGAALGEVTADGDIVGDDGRVLATFRHRVRAWVGRPALEMTLEIRPAEPPAGYPWHSYFGARFGWRDDRAALFRGVNGANTPSTSARPGSPDYLEIRLGAERTFVFTGGLPFAQKHGTRAADIVLVPEGETSTRFELLLAMDRDYPMPTAGGWTAPAPVVATDRGPPNGLLSSSLIHLDLPSLHLTSLRPSAEGRGVLARFIETAGFGGAADLTFAYPPAGAAAVDGEGHESQSIPPADRVIPLEFSAGETVRVRVDWPG